jgi:predicted aspartyl protease
MKFPYSAFLSPAPDTGEEVIIFRPEVPLRVYGPGGSEIYMALVDTGADNTILPSSIARELDIVAQTAKGPPAAAFGGQLIEMSYSVVELELAESDFKLRWRARVQFFDTADAKPETLLVGHQGFLDFFTPYSTVREPNDDLPFGDLNLGQ